MEDRTCTNCDKTFIYPSELKKHFKHTICCKKSDDDIKDFFIQIKINKKKQNKNIKLKCDNCNTLFVQKSTLTRHLNTSKCNKEKQERQTQIELLQKQIDKLKDQPLQQTSQSSQSSQSSQLPQSSQSSQIPHQIINQIEQQTINNINNINNVNNNLTINNITIIQHINPSGFETLPSNLSKQEMLRLLNLGDEGVIEIVKLVCEQDENKNFYKLNMNKNNISYLNNNYKIDICQDKELKDKLLKQCVILTYKMLISCSPLMTSDKICKINSNLQNISEKMKKEIYDNGLRNIIEYELRNNSKLTKDKISKYTKQISTNSEIKKQAKNNYIKVLKIKNDTNKNKLPNIKLSEINTKLGNPLTVQELEHEFTFNDFNINRFEYTAYYKYWIKRIEDEKEFINSHPCKTIGDITYFENRKINIENTIKKMEILNNKMREFDNNHNMIVTLDNFNVEIAFEYCNERV